MAYGSFDSWADAAVNYAIGLDDRTSFANQPYEILDLMAEIYSERAAGAIMSGLSGRGQNGIVTGGYIDELSEGITALFSGQFLYNVDVNGIAITDGSFLHGTHQDDVQLWTQSLMEDYLGMARPGPYELPPDYPYQNYYNDQIVSSDWLWWNFNALAMMRFPKADSMFDTPFSGYTRGGDVRKLTWKEAIIQFNNEPWDQTFIFLPGNQNKTNFGHFAKAFDIPDEYEVYRIKMTNVGVDYPQRHGTALEDKICKLYYYPVSYPVGTHDNRDYNVDAYEVFLEQTLDIVPEYTYVPAVDPFSGFWVEENILMNVGGQIGNRGFVNIGKPDPSVNEQRGWLSTIWHSNLIGESRWRSSHCSLYDFGIEGGYTYWDMLT